jgi:hypothetical protein
MGTAWFRLSASGTAWKAKPPSKQVICTGVADAKSNGGVN